MEITYYSLIVLLFCLCDISLIEGIGFSVDLIHRDSPKSPFYIPSETHYERVAKAIRRSINYANRFNKPSFSTKNIESKVLPNGGEYLMSYSIGTPPVEILGIVDTGSDVVWLQCQPCHPCYKQTTPIFNPSNSTTYKNIPCTSNTCKSVRSSSCSSDGDQQSCQYRIGYGDGSRSQGDLSLETLTLSSTKGSPVSFPKTIIGCGNSNTLVFEGEGSGIVGLGNGPVSLITQLGSTIQGKFSYCLGPTFSGTNSPSKLNFGDDAVVSGDGAISTPMFVEEVFYYLTIEAFSVGNKKVKFGSSSGRGSRSGNIIIDSGTTLTLLPDDVYSNLELAVAETVKLERVKAPSKLLSLCYASPSSGKLQFPIITVHFTGGDVQLNALNTFVKVSNDVICFAFAPTNQPVSIFGNLAQQNLLVGYDLQKKTLSIKPTDCTKQ
ncbi:PREDICTED: aspartic proteinase CDR1-like [Lupinus angustifolius]|uniref:aspartic proteinase CDR1-like n=1 Tax=Lupinus angustifolius TaxID=3871 RepID=UPI00092ED89C|nr:PREDICTED: aspartic proteinase CDR1-like [Lupinus angustifolius]